MSPSTSDRRDLPPGALELCVLHTLTAGPRHGYAIARRIEAESAEMLAVEEGTLYPALHRMERKGWLGSSWIKTETGRRARAYRLTRSGRARLRAERAEWERTTSAIARVIDARGSA